MFGLNNQLRVRSKEGSSEKEDNLGKNNWVAIASSKGIRVHLQSRTTGDQKDGRNESGTKEKNGEIRRLGSVKQSDCREKLSLPETRVTE